MRLVAQAWAWGMFLIAIHRLWPSMEIFIPEMASFQ